MKVRERGLSAFVEINCEGIFFSLLITVKNEIARGSAERFSLENCS